MDRPPSIVARKEQDVIYYMPTEEEIERIMRLFNFDRLVAIRHLQGKQMARELSERNLRYR